MNKKFNYFFSFLIVIILLTAPTFAQEFTLLKTPEQKELDEEKKYHKFQTHFFEALKQKSREDYNKAIESLDDCKTIYPDNAALNFEYAKNYLALKQYDNAILFSEKALLKKPKNIHILEHLKKTYRLQRDYKNAIIIQKQIVAIKPAKENDIIPLYISNSQRDKAKKSYLKLEQLGLLDLRKSAFKRMLFRTKTKKNTLNKTNNKQIKSVVKKTEKPIKKTVKYNKYIDLLTHLKKQEKQKQFADLLKDSNEALSLYPAQPILYLLNSKANKFAKKYQIALETLELGLDFIIDDNELLAQFYNQFYVIYLKLDQHANATKYKNKALALKKPN